MEMKDFIGVTFAKIKVGNDKDYIKFIARGGDRYMMAHDQGCCENVEIEDICGDLDDLIDTPIVDAKELSQHCDDKDCPAPPSSAEGPGWGAESYTWTFYDFRTAKGNVTIRWFGESNGYYSEDVDITKMAKERNGK